MSPLSELAGLMGPVPGYYGDGLPHGTHLIVSLSIAAGLLALWTIGRQADR